MELEGYWFFPPWLMVVFHLRASTGGFRCPLPEGLAPLERDYLRLNPLKNPLRVDLRPFPPWGCLFGAAGVMRASMGDAGGFLRHSSGRSVALWTARSLFTIRTKKPGEEEGIQGGVVASPVQNPGSESRRSPGASAWWGEISWLPDHPVGPQVFSLEISALRIQRPDPSSPVVLVVRTGTLEKKFSFSPNRLLGYWDDLFHRFCSNYFVSV